MPSTAVSATACETIEYELVGAVIKAQFIMTRANDPH